MNPKTLNQARRMADKLNLLLTRESLKQDLRGHSIIDPALWAAWIASSQLEKHLRHVKPGVVQLRLVPPQEGKARFDQLRQEAGL